MSAESELERVERILDTSGVPERIEALLPAGGVRARQLTVRTLLTGIALVMLAARDAFLTNVHAALLELPEADRRRLGVTAAWKHGEHELTYRQLEYTFGLAADELAKPEPDGTPSELLSEVLDALLEASVTVLGEPDSKSYAVDWTAHETWSRPPPKQAAQPEPHTEPAQPAQPEPHTEPAQPAQPEPHTEPAQRDQTPAAGDSDAPQPHRRGRSDREAAWGHRTVTHPAEKEMFFGYYLQALTAVRDEHGPEVPELARRMHLASCRHDPPAQIVPTLERMAAGGTQISDLLVDSGYAYRQPQTFALPIRRLGAQLIMDLHPNDRGPHGTHHGATCRNGNLYCPATPTTLLQLAPLPPGATPERTDTHDKQCRELARYKLSPLTGYDPDGYRRVICPAAQRKLRCPHHPASLTLPHDRPTILTPPEQPPACCTQKTITVPPEINAKTAQKHDYPSPQHRRSYNRRTAAERTFATLTDRATNDLSRGWCRLTGLTPIALFTAAAIIARNLRIADAFVARQAENERRAAQGLPPKQRKRRRQTAEQLINAANAPP